MGGGPRDWLQSYVTVNLGGTYDINKIRLNYQRTSNLGYLYGLQASTDGYTWTNLKGYFALNDAGDADGNAYFDWEPAEPMAASYVKVVSMNGGTFGLTEVEVYGKKSTSANATTLIRPEQIKVTSSSNGAETTLSGNYVNNTPRTFIATGNPKVVLDDEIYRSYWTSADGGVGTDDWIAFDLTRKHILSSAVVNYIDTTGYDVDIYTSEDGNEWNFFKKQTFNGEKEHYSLNGYRLKIDLSDVNTRYIKFQKSSAAPEGADGWKIGNIFFNTKNADYASMIQYTDRSSWKFLSGNVRGGSLERSLADGDLHSQAWAFDDGYIDVDMGEKREVSQVILQGGWWYGQSPMKGTVQVSDDGVSFDKVAEFDMLDGIYANTVLDFEPVDARYVRITCSYEKIGWRVAEVNLYCKKLIKETEFYLMDGNSKDYLGFIQNGTIRAEKSVCMDYDDPVTFIAALYEAEGDKLAKVQMQTAMCTGKETAYSVDFDLNEENFGEITDPSSYYIKTFLWDMDKRIPLCDADVFKNHPQTERSDSIIVNQPAEAVALLVSGDEPEEDIKLAAQKYYADILRGNSVGKFFLNLNFARSFTDSDTFDSLYWNVNIGADGNPILDENGNVTKTKVSDDPSEGEIRISKKIQGRGIDLYKIAVDEANKYGVEPWLTFRMNDHHYADEKGFKSAFIYNYPKYALDKYNAYEYFDYSEPAVRTYYKNYILEMCRKYDCDGIELDWLRTPNLFDSVTDESRQIMTDYMKEIKSGIDAIAKSKGKNIQIAVRGYSDEASNLAAGLDFAQWVADGTVDIITVMDFYWPTYYDIPIDAWRSSIEAKGGAKDSYKLYAGLDHAVSCDKAMVMNEEQMKGFASSAYNRGADGVYLFNAVLSYWPVGVTYEMNESGVLEAVNERYYSALTSIQSAQSAETGLRRYMKTRNTTYPFDVTDSRSLSVNTGTAPENGYYVIAVGLDDNEGYNEDVLSVTVNGGTTTQISDIPTSASCRYNAANTQEIKNIAQAAPRVARFRVDDLSYIKNGDNLITLTNSTGKAQSVKWFEIFVDGTENAQPIGE